MPVVALLTDFGSRDHYAGVMKGVVLGICPDAAVVDITHDVPPHDIVTAALELGAAYRYFPDGTVFLVVVDPGVGSARRGLAARVGGYRFVAPDNGVLTPVLDAAPHPHVVELTDRRYARPTRSRTFEGRDRFAPAAAWLATGVEVAAFGPPVADPVRLDLPSPEVGAGRIAGQVVRVDRFGNLVTNIDRTTFDRGAGPGTMRIDIGGTAIGRLVTTYADIDDGDIGALFGSTDHLELAAPTASAAQRLAVGPGAPVVVTWHADSPRR